MVSLIWYIHGNSPTNEAILVFLPGYEEISTTKDYLMQNNQNNDLIICQLHSQMASKEQRKAFQNFHPQRKVILATNIAETSLTINDVKIVIDCGKVKEKSFDSLSGMFLQEISYFLSRDTQHDFKKSNFESRMVFFTRVWGKVDFN